MSWRDASKARATGDACPSCGCAETPYVTRHPWGGDGQVAFLRCPKCDFALGVLECTGSIRQRAQARADAADEAYARQVGDPGRCVCDP